MQSADIATACILINVQQKYLFSLEEVIVLLLTILNFFDLSKRTGNAHMSGNRDYKKWLGYL